MISSTYNISEKNNALVWLPPKCASTSISWVLSYFEFSTVEFNVETNEVLRVFNNQLHFGHNMSYPPNYSNLTFICGVRNPYNRILSFYQSNSMNFSVSNFERFIEERIVKNPNNVSWDYVGLFNEKLPDYFIRAENVYEDLTKIPFIGQSELNNSGVLEIFCDKKLNQSSTQLSFEEYLTPNVKQVIQEIFSKQFELFGYEK
jgi:hypothetical protein